MHKPRLRPIGPRIFSVRKLMHCSGRRSRGLRRGGLGDKASRGNSADAPPCRHYHCRLTRLGASGGASGDMIRAPCANVTASFES